MQISVYFYQDRCAICIKITFLEFAHYQVDHKKQNPKLKFALNTIKTKKQNLAHKNIE